MVNPVVPKENATTVGLENWSSVLERCPDFEEYLGFRESNDYRTCLKRLGTEKSNWKLLGAAMFSCAFLAFGSWVCRRVAKRRYDV